MRRCTLVYYDLYTICMNAGVILKGLEAEVSQVESIFHDIEWMVSYHLLSFKIIVFGCRIRIIHVAARTL